MQTLELTARTLEEAQRNAAERLGVDADSLNLQVLEETKGLFGKSTLRVLATVKEVEAPAVTPKPAGRPAARGRAKAAAIEPEPAPTEEPAVEAAAPPVEEEKPKARRTLKREPKSAAVVAPPKPTEDSAAPTPEGEAAEEVEIVATDADGDRFMEIAKSLLEPSGLKIDVMVGSVTGKYVNLRLDGKDSSYMVGKHGEVLNSLQYLVNVVSNRRNGNGVRATVECNDYRRRREEALTKLATRIADEVKQRGEEAVLDALPAFERRIVHKALSEIEGITTYSEGEEPNRRVVIAPVD
jgi:spoIIIJ-associated protein